jgi:hypothetical protein
MQIILNKICALENGTTTDGVNTAGCPSDCEIAVAPCLQYSDNLGNTVTSLPIKDYVILIGNRICTILTSIANLQNQIDALDTRVTNLENGSGGGGGGTSFNVTSDCLSQSALSLQEYINVLDAAFCELQANSGTQLQYISATSASACVSTNSPQMADPAQIMGNYQQPQWLASPNSSFQQIQNLWVAICDIRTGLTNLQTQLDACCAPDVPCPGNLPRPTIELAKQNASNDIFFVVSAGGGATLSPSGTGVIIGGQEWQLIRFEGSVIASANGTTSLVTTNLPFVGSASQVYYDGSTQNKITSITGVSNSLGVTVTGTFYWKNLDTLQECTTTPTNNGISITNLLVVACPTLWTSPSANITYTPFPIQTCSSTTGASFSINLGNFPPVTNIPGAFVTGTLQYTNTLGINQNITITLGTGGSYAASGVQCNSSPILTITGINQNGVSRSCSVNATIDIPTAGGL